MVEKEVQKFVCLLFLKTGATNKEKVGETGSRGSRLLIPEGSNQLETIHKNADVMWANPEIYSFITVLIKWYSIYICLVCSKTDFFLNH